MSDYREVHEQAREHGLKARNETRLLRAELAVIRAAIQMLPATCRYHGDNLERDGGWSWQDACCDTGKPALARRKAEDAIGRLEP